MSCITSRVYPGTRDETVNYRASDSVNLWGINAYEVHCGLEYLNTLREDGVLGHEIPCDVDFCEYGSFEFFDELMRKISLREGDFCNNISNGFVRAASAWGRLEEDWETGLLEYPCHGVPEHGYCASADVLYGFCTLLSDRDHNVHVTPSIFLDALQGILSLGTKRPPASAGDLVRIFTDKMEPFHQDPERMLMLDYSTNNMYSEHIAKATAWILHCSLFWKQSMLFCDYRWPDMINTRKEDRVGSSGQAEPEFLRLVSGREIGWGDGVELGRRIWNLDSAIWALQGRHRDDVRFSPYVYTEPFPGPEGTGFMPYPMPGLKENGDWAYINAADRAIDEPEFESFKTRFYQLEGWDTTTGHPTRATLEDLDLGYAADHLVGSF